jgi:hypothetical protein
MKNFIFLQKKIYKNNIENNVIYYDIKLDDIYYIIIIN